MKRNQKDILRIAMTTLICVSLTALGLFAVSLASNPRSTDEDTILYLNQKYIDAFLHSDVEWYRDILAEDFVCIDSDGSILHRAQFLEQAGGTPDVVAYELEQVNVRFYGDVALVQATGRFKRTNGTVGLSHYTDIYVRGERTGRWSRLKSRGEHDRVEMTMICDYFQISGSPCRRRLRSHESRSLTFSNGQA